MYGSIYLIIFFIYLFYIETEVLFLTDLFSMVSWLNYYDLLNFDMFEELEGLGLALVYYSSFLFFLSIIFLFLACICVVLLIITAKKIRYYSYFQDKKFFFFNYHTSLLFRAQNFFTQEYENIYLKHGLLKNYKIGIKFHRYKNSLRRV